MRDKKIILAAYRLWRLANLVPLQHQRTSALKNPTLTCGCIIRVLIDNWHTYLAGNIFDTPPKLDYSLRYICPALLGVHYLQGKSAFDACQRVTLTDDKPGVGSEHCWLRPSWRHQISD
jgi:hypothetical protein